MKVLIVSTMVPFVWGGAEELAVHLQNNIIEAGHKAEIMRIPFQWDPATRIPSQMLMVKALELQNVDRVIGLKFPAYLIRHPNKVLWVAHQFRQAYDMYDAGLTHLNVGQQENDIRQMIIHGDNACFQQCKRIFTISDVTRDRLLKYNQVNAEILRHPINDPWLFPGGESQGYIFAGGRINNVKRQHLLLEAMAQLSSPPRLIIAGPTDSPQDAERLQRLVEHYGLSNSVTLDMRFMPRQDYANYINHAAAVAYLPYDEDSIGYVTMEAATAGKPILTTTDSGGVLALVKHLQTGWVSDANPSSLAATLSDIASSNKREEMGQAARELMLSLDLTWAKTVEKLLS